MAGTITTAMCTQFKIDLMKAVHKISTQSGHTIMLCLIKTNPTTTFTATLSRYATIGSDEASGTGYTAGGVALTCATGTPTNSGTTAYADFDDTSWTGSTISANGAVIYNASATNSETISVHDFGATKSSSAGTFSITFPAAGASTAILRLA